MIYSLLAGDKTEELSVCKIFHKRGWIMDNLDMVKEINKLKNEKNAIILAHNYQIPEIQDLADVVGDSLKLSQIAQESKADIIVLCGVKFMAESAKILSPEKKVLLPKLDAGCPMADMINVESLREFKAKHKGSPVVCYVNSSAEVKAESDICVTSSNALKIVSSLQEEKILFIPDKNLGGYINDQLNDKEVISFDGYCITHNQATINDVEKMRSLHPEALLLAHPECDKEIVKRADFVGSTSAIIEFAKESEEESFIIATEVGIMHKLQNDNINSNKKFFMLSPTFLCEDMKKIELKDLYKSLKEEKYEISIDENIRIKAKKSLDKMLELS